MTESTLTNTAVQLDAQGFVAVADQWTAQTAQETARANGVCELTDRHWWVINSARRAYLRNGTSPWLRMLAKVSGVSIRELFWLFPRGPLSLVASIAAIPEAACLPVGV
jgi:TusE/DsrC/DsvC family sulfur relay protein